MKIDMKDKAAVRDMLISGATGAFDLIKKAEVADPHLAESLTPKALIGTKSVWITPATAFVGWVTARYGIATDPDTSALVAALMAWVAVMVCRYFTRSPIGGIVTSGTTPVPPAPGLR